MVKMPNVAMKFLIKLNWQYLKLQNNKRIHSTTGYITSDEKCV